MAAHPPPPKPSLRSTRRSEYNNRTDSPDQVTQKKPKRLRTNLDSPNEQLTVTVQHPIKRRKIGQNDVQLPKPPPKSPLLKPPLSPKVVSKSRRAPKHQSAAELNAISHLANGMVDVKEKSMVNGSASATEKRIHASPKLEKRTLRSQDSGGRIKSDLALYFPNYDELLQNDTKSSDLVTTDSILYVTDEPPNTSAGKLGKASPQSSPSGKAPVGRPRRSSKKDVPSLPKSPSAKRRDKFDMNTLVNAQRIDFATLAKAGPVIKKDPLIDDLFNKAHRRAERQEKQLRNIEREHAQHEKAQLERLLDGLRGQDWLRIMGISGITESEKKEYEPKRDMFIGEVEGLIEKFRIWKEEEKRRKIARDQMLQAEEEAAALAVGSESEDAELANGDVDPAEETQIDVYDEEQAADEIELGDGDPPDWSDIDADAWAARQLQLEASTASASALARAQAQDQQGLPIRSKTPESTKAFKSFYKKPHMRTAAVGGHRRSGRSVSAFGKPVPEPNGKDSALSNHVLSPKTAKANARARRMSNRTRKETAKARKE